MKKILIIIIIIYSLCTNQLFAEYNNGSALNNLLVPAKISQLDWELLKIQVSINDKVSWDTYGLVIDISFEAIEYKSNPKVLMICNVNKSVYLGLEDYVLKKILKDVVEGAGGIIQLSLKGINIEKDILASFVIGGRGTVATYLNGNIKLK